MDIEKDSLLCQQLTSFFESWAAFSKFSTLNERLKAFFLEWKEIMPAGAKKDMPQRIIPGQNLDLEKLGQFFEEIPSALGAAKRAGFLCDPWAVAGLKRDEVRNSSVLAWWLDPRGSHGFGATLLELLLKKLNENKHHELPITVSQRCNVKIESCPDGEKENRVDIEIDDPYFYLIIEVKIDAPEGNNQLKRYCNIAKMKAGEWRPWAVVYLTPNGRGPAVDNEGDPDWVVLSKDRVSSISWGEVAFLIDGSARQHTAHFQKQKFPELVLTGLLARTFSKHIRQF